MIQDAFKGSFLVIKEFAQWTITKDLFDQDIHFHHDQKNK